MIMIPVDEADAFDRLAILDVKGRISVRLEQAISDAITVEMLDRISQSAEYKSLVEANRTTFNWVEKAKRNECSAQDVDRANHSRYLAKKALQEKFFPKSPLTETKTERPY